MQSMPTVIKANAAHRTAQGVAFNFEDMTAQANKYLDGVRLKAAEIVQAAQKEAQAISARAEEEGRKAAMRAVESVLDEKVGKRMETLLPALQKVVDDIAVAKQSWLRHWETSAIQLAAAMASRVIRKELSCTPEIPLTLVTEALQLSAGSPNVRIYLNSSDLEALGSQVNRLVAEMRRIGGAEIVADDQVSPGGCRLETNHGLIDQTFDAQLARIEAELT